MKEITVVIPNYNGMKYLPECMTSLCKDQKEAPEYDVLIIDNASSDGSAEYLRNSWCTEKGTEQADQTRTTCGIRLITLSGNTGFCHAVNLGIQESQTPYVILLNNDTKVESGFIKGLYDAISADDRIFSVSARMLMWDRPELIDDAGDRYCALGWAYSRGKGRPTEKYDIPVSVFSACGGAAIYRRRIFEEIGYFDEEHFAYLEDLDIGYRAQIYGYENKYEPSAGVLHYGSASTGSRYNPKKTELASANSVYIIAKNMPLLQWILNLPFFLPGFGIKFLFFCKKGMGKLYLKGLLQGLKRSVSLVGKQHKVPFRWAHLWNYVKIQWQLYLNVFRILMKS